MTHASVDELKLDLVEYEQLHTVAMRPKVQESLSKEIDRLRREVLTLEKAAQGPKATGSKSSTSTGGGDNSQSYHENITNYAWDQSDKFLKLYLTLGNLNTISDDNIHTDLTDRSVTVKVEFPNKSCRLHIARLCEDIVPKECYCKKKSEYVLVMLKKVDVGKTWQTVTEREKKAKEKKAPKYEDNEDPSSGITSMLKNMYDDGDDEMKRTISKAWYQSQTKQGAGAEAFPEL
uniref:Calcyclin-binding protein n=1 Tax=Arion vulgaris TaxID=1028688 RepID=A0A0B7AKY2_9EUPU